MLLRLRHAAFVLLAVPAVAAAEPVLEGSQIEIDIQLPDGEGGFEDAPANDSEFRLERQFNRARCFCATNVANDLTQFRIELRLDTPISSNDTDVDVWLGQSCLTETETTRDRLCGMTPAEVIPNANDLNTVKQYVFRVDRLVAAGVDSNGQPNTCDREEFSGGVYVAPDPGNTNTYNEETEQFENVWEIDPEPPPTPSSFTVAIGAENAIELDWEALTSREDDVYKWQVLCARVDDAGGVSPAFDEPPVDPWFETSSALCGADDPEEFVKIIGVGDTPPTDAGVPDAGPAPDAGMPDAMVPDAAPAVFATIDDVPAPLRALDPAYLCGEASSTATSIRVEGLTNNENYHFVLLAVDEARNVAGVTTGEILTPREVTDFWEDLHENGSEAEGGFCLFVEAFGEGGGPGGAITEAMRAFRDETLASTALGRWLIDVYYDDLGWLGELAHDSAIARVVLGILVLPLVLLALLWHALTLPGLLALGFVVWRLRRARRLALTAAAVLVPATASAQSFAPYWEDETYVEEEGPTDVKWHVGVKVGPYVPGIDAQLGMEGDGPYQNMFGGYNLVPMLDVDRVLFHLTAGQIAIGGSVGFLTKTAKAFAWQDTNRNGILGDTGDRRVRSEGDETSFRLIPMSIDAAFRLTALDDEWGVPVVPYVRGGLGYYIWWITAPSGDLAVVDGDKARGASLGLVGSAGLAIRAERIDPQAAASMRESGLYHAGFYGEYQVAWVDGFGNEKKLSVGDNTFYVGFDFEF